MACSRLTHLSHSGFMASSCVGWAVVSRVLRGRLVGAACRRTPASKVSEPGPSSALRWAPTRRASEVTALILSLQSVVGLDFCLLRLFLALLRAEGDDGGYGGEPDEGHDRARQPDPERPAQGVLPGTAQHEGGRERHVGQGKLGAPACWPNGLIGHRADFRYGRHHGACDPEGTERVEEPEDHEHPAELPRDSSQPLVPSRPYPSNHPNSFCAP